MRLLQKVPDGDPEGGVTAYVLIEVKWLFSIVLLKFEPNADKEKPPGQNVMHSHAFPAVTWFLRGEAEEVRARGAVTQINRYLPSFRPKFTSRRCVHRFRVFKETWALSFRGRWAYSWKEWREDGVYTLTSGRRVVKVDLWDQKR